MLLKLSKIAFPFWLSFVEKLLEFGANENIETKYQEKNNQNVVRVTRDRDTRIRVTRFRVPGVRVAWAMVTGFE